MSTKKTTKSAQGITVTAKLLRQWPLPQPGEEGDKETRGRVLIIGGASEMPGAVILAATAALRAGAGKLQIATAQSIAPQVAVAVPESRTFGLAETRSGAISTSAIEMLAERADEVDAVLVGPGFIDEKAIAKWLGALLPLLEKPAVVLDAAALACLSTHPDALHRFKGRSVITPHAGEMASLLNIDKKEIEANAPRIAQDAATRFQSTVALKGAITHIADPSGHLYCNRSGNVGLATSGSGDTLSGIVTGLLARGTDITQAVNWAVHLHGAAGDVLAKKIGPLGFLARELLDEIPPLLLRFQQ